MSERKGRREMEGEDSEMIVSHSFSFLDLVKRGEVATQC